MDKVFVDDRFKDVELIQLHSEKETPADPAEDVVEVEQNKEMELLGKAEEKILDSLGNFKTLSADTLALVDSSIKNISNKYKKFYDNADYSQEFKDRKRAEEEAEIQREKEVAYDRIDRLTEAYLKRISSQNEEVESLEYQTRLSNLLRLAELSGGKLDTKDLQFVIDAKDSTTLKILRNKYKSEALYLAFYEVDADTHKNALLKRANMVKNYIKSINREFKNVDINTVIDALKQ